MKIVREPKDKQNEDDNKSSVQQIEENAENQFETNMGDSVKDKSGYEKVHIEQIDDNKDLFSQS